MKKTQPPLAGDLAGASDRRPPLVLLHGLTFDRTMWHPALAHLAELDPARPVLALDLPGHGESPAWPRYDLESLTDAVHRAVTEAGRTWWRSPRWRRRRSGRPPPRARQRRPG